MSIISSYYKKDIFVTHFKTILKLFNLFKPILKLLNLLKPIFSLIFNSIRDVSIISSNYREDLFFKPILKLIFFLNLRIGLLLIYYYYYYFLLNLFKPIFSPIFNSINMEYNPKLVADYGNVSAAANAKGLMELVWVGLVH